jgi:hypothetical protein
MDKNVGFRRNIYLDWLDAVAAQRLDTDDLATIRLALEPLVGETITNADNLRMAIDILINIWCKTSLKYPQLHAEALDLAGQIPKRDWIWLHYGLTCLYYDFFRFGVATIGHMSRYSETITSKDVKKRVFAEFGQYGALDKGTERIVFSLRNWGVLRDTSTRSVYEPVRHGLTTCSPKLEYWLLAVALTAHPADSLTFADLTYLPELFPFKLSIKVDDIRSDDHFEVQRQGMGWDMVFLRIPDKDHKLQSTFL